MNSNNLVDEQTLMNWENEYSAPVYTKRPVVIAHGKGAVLYDINGQSYIDCVGGHGVAVVGHSHPAVVDTIVEQARQLLICPGSFYNDVRAKLLKKLDEITPKPLSVSFLSNSGAEAIETAIKLARIYTKKKKIISTVGAFHGRTLGALSLTWRPEYRNPFQPLLPSVDFVPFGNIERIKDAIDKDTAAIIVEPIQGEGGVNLPPDDFLPSLRELCDEYDVLLILDEVQTGFGRTGKMFAMEHWDVVPDILVLAKAAAGGVPIGITMSSKEIMSAFKPATHGSTFGGNPLAASAALAAINVIINEKLPQQASDKGKYFIKCLEAIKQSTTIIREVRGKGLMIGVEYRFRIGELILEALKKGILLLTAGKNIIRLLPPLVIEYEQIDQVVSVLDELTKSFAQKKRL